jgi:hypothetical protein
MKMKIRTKTVMAGVFGGSVAIVISIISPYCAAN